MYDYYKILGVNRDASQEEIKRAYRSKAKQFHPDVNDSPKAQEYFSILNEAHAALTDDTKKYLHDLKLKYGHTPDQKTDNRYNTNNRRGPYSKFHYDWESFAAAQAAKKRNMEKENPLIYNLFFASGMLLGFVMCFVAIRVLYYRATYYPVSLLLIPGIVLVWGGFVGITGKENNLHTRMINRIKRFF